MPPDRIELSVVLPIHNEERLLAELYERLSKVLDGMGLEYEVILVNDGSRDRSWDGILELCRADARVRGVDLSRNFGHQVAITAGIHLSRGEAVVVMDSDLQDPPELIPELYARYREGYDVAYAQRRARAGETWFKKTTANFFYRLLTRLTNLPIPLDTGDFRLMSRRVVEGLRAMGEHSRFVRGMVTWIGFRQIAVPYDRQPRGAGETKFSIFRMVRFALDGITGFSHRPLQIASHFGILCALASLAFMGFFVLYWLAGGTGLVPGWTSLIVVSLFLGGVQLIAIGILGEYVGRVYEEVKRRPLYLLSDQVNFDERSQPPSRLLGSERVPGRSATPLPPAAPRIGSSPPLN